MPTVLERFPGKLGKVGKREVPPDVDIFNDDALSFDFMLRREFLKHRAAKWDAAIGENNRVAAIIYSRGPDRKTRIIKVPRDSERSRRHGRAEVKILKFLEETLPQPTFVLPRVERVEEIPEAKQFEKLKEDPFYFVLTPVPGDVVENPQHFTLAEKKL